jgi:hypothetical protein
MAAAEFDDMTVTENECTLAKRVDATVICQAM